MRLGFNHNTAALAALILLLGIFGLIKFRLDHPLQTHKVLGAENDVMISAYIRVNDMRFRVFPEKRIPRIGNWSTFVDIALVNCNNPSKTYHFYAIPTDLLGYGVVTFPSDVFTFDGPYRVYIRGFSHLNRRYNCYQIDQADTFIDFTLEGKELLAGETSIVYDNYINSLDLSTIVQNMFSMSDYRDDLNQDGKVNSLDLANQIFNFFTTGD